MLPQEFSLSNKILECLDTKLCHEFSELFSNHEEKVDNVLGFTLEFLS